MVRRISLDKNGLVISKPGFDVLNPALVDGEKIFDSNWAYSNFLLASGKITAEIPGNSTHTVYFPQTYEALPILEIRAVYLKQPIPLQPENSNSVREAFTYMPTDYDEGTNQATPDIFDGNKFDDNEDLYSLWHDQISPSNLNLEWINVFNDRFEVENTSPNPISFSYNQGSTDPLYQRTGYWLWLLWAAAL